MFYINFGAVYQKIKLKTDKIRGKTNISKFWTKTSISDISLL